MQYNIDNIRKFEQDWQKRWEESGIYKVALNKDKDKFYILDMFPYPSGSGLHVGHPLGYIATDIYGRYKRLQGYNVLHPMGYDAFGLPAEQYAIQTGKHPAKTTEENISTFREQLKKIGLGYDWSRELKTCDPKFYKWTQWIFLQLFKHWYNKAEEQAEPIDKLVKQFEKSGNADVRAACDEDTPTFTAAEWNKMDEKEQQKILQHYRLAYLAYADVNWCPELGTVLANEEVLTDSEHGLVSERGGHPVERKSMRQWFLRITAYADRLLENHAKLDWPEPVVEMQRNWIGRSEGALIRFEIQNSNFENAPIEAFTTRPDTIFGATYMVLAPEHDLVEVITTAEQKEEVEKYINYTKTRTERERLADVEHITGAFTGGYAIHPFTGDKLPIWIADYVLEEYGTGAIMAVPAHDERDYKFAQHFNLPIKQVVQPNERSLGNEEKAYTDKEGNMINSDFLNGLDVSEAIQKAIDKLEEDGLGERNINYKLRDFLFSRQRYWGEPFPIVFKDGIPYPVDEDELPVELPEMESFKPTESGEPPLTRAKDWVNRPDGTKRETNTMPGWAGSNWYFLRYMDPHNEEAPVDKDREKYWGNVDFYMGGTEHATTHLIYARFVNMFLYDIGAISHEEPFQRLENQGMIQGNSAIIYRDPDKGEYISSDKIDDKKKYQPVRIPVEYTQGKFVDVQKLRSEVNQFKGATFKFDEEKEQFFCDREVEKMSKSKFNVVNPDDVIAEYGTDTFRLYEMFLGPIDQDKPWDTEGIDGAHRFLRKVWNLFCDPQSGNFVVNDDEPTEEELRHLHKTIKKVREDVERLSFNTAISAMMVCANELTKLKCHKRAVLEPLLVLLSPFAPHMGEELWEQLGHKDSIIDADLPDYDDSFTQEDTIEYPIQINGKKRATLNLPADKSKEEIEKEVLASEALEKWLKDKEPKRVIVVPKRIVNIVV